jgi:hypothetical protein
MAAMADSLTTTTTIFGALIVLIGLIFWIRRVRQKGDGGPFIELEQLVKCRSCGSLIPEGVRKCAFCGAWQHQEDSGEQINGPKSNGTNAAEMAH